jgi:Sulfotransferase family
MSETSAPVFVVGAMRSGTTLLRLMLSEHSELAIPAESHFLSALFRDLGPERVLSGDDLGQAIEIITGSPEWQRDFKQTETQLRQTLGDGPLSMAELIERVFRLEIAATGKPRWGDKTPAYLFRVPDLLACFPSAKIVAIVRDPRDVYLSLREHGWVGYSTWEIGRYIARCGGLVTRWSKRFPPERFSIVRYEDVVLQPEVTLKRVCDFLCLPFEPTIVGFHEHADENVQGWELEIGAHTKLLRPMQTTDVERWRDARSLRTRVQLAQVEAFTSEVLAQFGYGRRLTPSLRAPAPYMVAKAARSAIPRRR